MGTRLHHGRRWIVASIISFHVHRQHRDHQRVLRSLAQPLSAQRLHERRVDNLAVLRNSHTDCSFSASWSVRYQVPQLHGRALAGGGVALAQGKGDGRQRCDACRVRGGGFGCHEGAAALV